VLADSLILWVDPMFADVAAGKSPVTVQAWVMVVGFLLQMYFDFSGYSDMAAGVARLFGVRLPLNFYSPMRVTSIMDWWRRWHMSLGRFVNDYIFQSLALPLTRKAVMRGYGRWG
jgi:D-alanyl-lipoteichoic acid acyltransferase DltB (MBOAT superfamily)